MAVGDRRRHGADRLLVASWRGNEGVALLTPRPDRRPPDAATIQDQLAALTRRGVRRAVTSALAAQEQDGFLAAGFEVQERLHLLTHDLDTIPEVRADVTLRRGRRTDRAPVLDVDHRAFDPFWRLDAGGLRDAIDATPSSRYRVAVGPEVVGYAVWGRANERGYLQRLAVDPARHREGIGTALVADGLTWLRRHRVRMAAVNTQEGNTVAVAAYHALGFRSEPEGLTVLAIDLPGLA